MQNRINRIIVFIEEKNNYILCLTILGVIIAGIAYSYYLGETLRYPDEQAYYDLATNLITKKQYSLDGVTASSFWPPGYPFLLAIFTLLGANIIHLRILNFLALALSIYLLHNILEQEFSKLAATASIFLIIVYPVLFYTAGTLYPQIFATSLLLSIIYFLRQKTIANWHFILLGILFGALLLTIPSYIFVLFIISIWYLFFQKDKKRIGIVVITAIVLIGAWTIRNYTIWNSFMFVSANSGFNLLLGNSENTTPNAGVTVDISKYENFANQKQMNELEQDRYYLTQALDYMLNNKLQTLKLYWAKFFNYFNYRNQLETNSESTSFRDLIMLLTYGPLLILFIVRLTLLPRLKPSHLEILFIALYIASAFFHAFFFTRIRFRLPFDFLLIGIVSIFINQIISNLRFPTSSLATGNKLSD